jgi:hypothetical protein
MYALGILLSAVSNCAILLALRAHRRLLVWWVAYGACSAALALTHYFGLFTVFAQALFVVGFSASRAWQQRSFRGLVPLAGIIIAGAVAALLFGPWLPVLARQATEVRHDFWISSLSGADLLPLVSRWAMGLDSPVGLFLFLWLSLPLALLVWRLALRDGAAWFFALQAGLPWVVALAWSAWAQRPIVVERYFCFAQVGWIGLLTILFTRLPEGTFRLLFAFWTLLPVGVGLTEQLASLPDGPSARSLAMQELASRYRPGEVVLVANPADLNHLHVLAGQNGMSEVRLLWSPPSRPGLGHIAHMAVLRAEEMSGYMAAAVVGDSCWAVVPPHSLTAPPGMAAVWQRHFQDTAGTEYLLVRYERVT